jgi:integrase/recombinase XerD
MNTITFSQAIEGYLLAVNARRLSPHTISDYLNTYRKFSRFLDEAMPFADISPKDVEAFFREQTVAKKTLSNYHTGLSALWTWGVKEGLVDSNILQHVDRIKPEKKAIVPYSQDDIQAMLSALDKSRSYTRLGKKESCHRLPQADRNRAIIFLLLDTGLRTSELSKLRIHQVDVRNQRIKVMGKDAKERMLPFSSRTGQILWRYLTQRKEASAGDPLFITKSGRSLDRMKLLHILMAIGERAGVKGVNVHRFRHTFAINYLRNGGDSWSLQMMLGHSTMEMVKTTWRWRWAEEKRTNPISTKVCDYDGMGGPLWC